MRILAVFVFASFLVTVAPTCAQEVESLLSVEFRAENREQPGGGPEALSFWSFYDHAESVQVVVGASENGLGSGTVFSEVALGVARIVWEDASKEMPDYEATIERAYWLPTIFRSQIRAGDPGTGTEWVVATLKPDEMLRQLRESDPELLLTALWVRSCYVGRGGAADGTGNCTQREIPLYMAH